MCPLLLDGMYVLNEVLKRLFCVRRRGSVTNSLTNLPFEMRHRCNSAEIHRDRIAGLGLVRLPHP